jgi:hypothetical protein
MRNKIKLTALSLIASAFLVGCGGSDGDSTSTTQTGTFVDAPVSGLEYSTSSGISGTTDAAGHFNYTAGDSVTFSVGNVALGSSTATEVVTPMNIANNDTARASRIAYILQSLDTDGNPTDAVIKLPTKEQLQNLLTAVDLNDDNNVITVMERVKNEVEANLGVDLPDITIAEAKANMDNYTKQEDTPAPNNNITPETGFTKEFLEKNTIYWLTDGDSNIDVLKFKDGRVYIYTTDGEVETIDGKELKAYYSVDNNHILTLDAEAFGFEGMKEFIKVYSVETTSNGGLKIHLVSDGIEDDDNAYELVKNYDGSNSGTDYFFTNLQDAQDFVKETYNK